MKKAAVLSLAAVAVVMCGGCTGSGILSLLFSFLGGGCG